MFLDSFVSYISAHQDIFIPVGAGVGVFCLANLYYGQTRFAGPSGCFCGPDPPCCDAYLLPCLRCNCRSERNSSNDEDDNYSPV
jgi:hypothetical protein